MQEIGTLKDEIKALKKQLIERNATIHQLEKRIDEQTKKSSDLIKAQMISPFGYWNFMISDNKFVCSDELYRILEIPNTTDLSNIDTIFGYFHPDEPKGLDYFRRIVYQVKTSYNYTIHIVLQDGNSKIIDVKATVQKDSNNLPIQIYGTALDITESHFRTEKLRKNENLFRNIFNQFTDIIITFELVKSTEGQVIDYIFTEVNPIFEMKFDLLRPQIINKKLSTQPQLFQTFNQQLKITAITQQPQQDRFFIQSLDAFMDVLIYSPTQNTLVTVWRDVTLMVESNQNLHDNEEKYHQFFSIVKDGLFLLDFYTGKINEVNPAGCKMFGYKTNEFTSKPFDMLCKDKPVYENKILTQKTDQLREQCIRSDGSEFPIEATLSYFNWSGRKVVICSVRDISERINKEKELIENEQKFKNIFNFSNDAILIVKNFRIVEYNQKSLQLFHSTPKQLQNKTLWELSPQKQSNQEKSKVKIIDYIQQSIQGKQLQFEWEFYSESRDIFYADIKLSPIISDNEKVIQVIVRDISPQKQIEEALIQKENRWRNALDSSSIGVWDWNVNTNEFYYSNTWKKIIGYESDEITNRFEEFEKRIHPEDIANVYNKIESYLESKTSEYNATFRFRCKNGSFKWINSNAKIYSYTPEGKPEHLIGTHIDITRNVLNYNKVLLDNNKYQKAANLSNMGYWELNLKNMLFSGSNEMYIVFGIKQNNPITLKHIENLVHPEDQKDFIGQFSSTDTDSFDLRTFRIIIKNQTRFILSKSIPVTDTNNQLIGYTGIVQDITQLKKEELKLKSDQNLTNSYLDKNQQIILILQDQKFIFINDKFSDLTGYKTEEFKAKNMPFLDLVTTEDKKKAQLLFDNIIEKNKTHEKTDLRILTKNNRVKWVDLQVSSFKFKEHRAIFLLLNDITERKNIEFKLLQDNLNLKNIVEHSPLGIANIDLDGKIQSTNTSFEEISGFNQKNILNKDFKQILNEKDFDTIKNGINTLRNGIKCEFILDIETNNNRWCSLKIAPSYDLHKKIIHFILYLENIDIPKKQIDLLTEENYIHKAIIYHSNIGIGLFNPSGELYIHNQAFTNTLDIDSIKSPSIRFSDLNIARYNQPEKFKDLIQNNQTINITHHLSSTKIISLDLISLDVDKNTAILIIAHDISKKFTEQKQTEERLEKFQLLFEKLPSATALIDRNRNIIYYNTAYSNILKNPQKNLNNTKFDQLISTEYIPTLITNFSELFAGVVTKFDHIISIKDKENKTVWINSNVVHITNQFDESIYALQTLTDITQTKEDDYSVKKTERIKTLNYLSNNFAHQFNNHLMTIYGESYLLKSNIKDELLKKHANILYQTTLKTSDLAQNLLSFSKKNNQINVTTNIPKIISEIVKDTQFSPEIQVDTKFDVNSENTIGNPSQLRHALQNIINNANEAMPKDGTLSIETQSVYFENETTNKSTELGRGKFLRITISNTGTGIASDYMPRIFDPFYTTKRLSMNSGLGLTISKKIVNDHRGIIRVKSIPNKGTTCIIYLPQYEDDYLKNLVEPNEKLIVKGSANIMIIDDDNVARIVCSELLKKLRYNIYGFSSAKKAILFYKENGINIDLVILDKHMPEMDGLEVHKKLKQINAQIKVILLTGYNIDENIETIFDKKGSRIVQKPVSIEKLSQAIYNLLLTN